MLSKERLSNLYSPHGLKMIEIGYGSKGIISQGGIEEVDSMFSNMELSGKKILDFGCGFGGVAMYLAKHYQAEFIGVDREPYMIDQAEKILEREKSFFKGKVSFQVLKKLKSLGEFADETFDLVFSKEVFYHLPIVEKKDIITEFFRILKPKGKALLAEWFISTPVPTERVKKSIKIENFCHFVMPEVFKSYLLKAGFTNIQFTDSSQEHIKYSEKDLERLRSPKNEIVEEMGKESFAYFIEAWKSWLEALKSQDLLAFVLEATKP